MSKAALLNVNAESYDSLEANHDTRREISSGAEWMCGRVATDLVEENGSPEGGLSILDALQERSERRPSTRDNAAGNAATQVPSDLLLAKAIDAMERRTRRSKRRAIDSSRPFLGAFAEAEMLGEDGSVFDLAHRVAEIETRLVDRVPSGEANPVGAALARLEARLDTFTRQSSLAEAVALQHTFAQLPKPTAQSDSLTRLEEKLDAILKAIEVRTSASSPIALAASFNARRHGDRRLGAAIDEIARRQQMLEFDGDELPIGRRNSARKTERAFLLPRQVAKDENASLTAIRSEIAELVKKVDGLCQDVSARKETAPGPTSGMDPLSADIAKLSRTMGDLAARHSLSTAISSVVTISDRLSVSQDLGISDTTRQDLAAILEATHNLLLEMDGGKSADDLTQRLQRVGDFVDGLAHNNVELPSVAAIRQKAQEVESCIVTAELMPPAVKRIEHLIGSLKVLVETQDDRSDADFSSVIEELRDLVANPPSQIAFVRIDLALEAFENEVSKATAEIAPAEHKRSNESLVAQGDIEDLLRDLSRKMDAAQSPGADAETLNALQGQIAHLSSRFEKADDGLTKLNALQQSMQDVFAHLEQTRASVETSAAEAAREVLRIAVQDGHAHRDVSAATSLANMQSMQDEAEKRTRSALSAVQETLSKVVDRLSFMENEVAEVRDGNKTHILAKITPTRPAAAKLGEISLGRPDALFDQSSPERSPEKINKSSTDAAAVSLGGADSEIGKADFIAAARRAAKTVQTSLSTSEAGGPAASKHERNARTVLVEKFNDYVARHKKPVLLGMAALLVIVGTITVAHRIGLGRSEVQKAEIAPRTNVAATTKPAAPQVIGAGQGLASMALQPQTSASNTPVVKSKPISQQMSAGLPMFATRAPAPPPPPMVPVKLKSMAEAGDAGAEYVLGTQYAEGRGILRDFKAAASWYQKAADKGVVPAQYRLASLYEKGLGVAKDRAKARSLYLQAAEAGNPRAMHNLAVILADGDGKPDYEGAATWFRKAAQLGMEDSQYNLAILLARGLGVQQSLVQSYQWFAIAAAQDDAEAAKKRDEVATKLATADLAVAKALAASFRPRAASVAATEVQPPPGGWDGAPTPSALNSARPKISSL